MNSRFSAGDVEETLRAFARWCALQVIDKWDAPDVVRRYLETGDDELRAATKASAVASARISTVSASKVAVRNLTRAVARVPAKDVTRANTYRISSAAAMAAAWSASNAPVIIAVRTAAWSAARASAEDPAWSTDSITATAVQNTKLTEMLMAMEPMEVQGG